MIFRAFYGSKTTIDGPGGMQVNAIGGFFDRLGRLIRQRMPRRLAIADDFAWRPAWRVELIETYKSHRVAEPVPAGLEPQIPVIRAILEAVGVDIVGVDEYEAEDVIATWSRLAEGTIEISSGDRDLFALVEDPRVCVLYPEKSGLSVIDESEVTRRYGIPGRRYADFAILRGDPSDGLPGVGGVGEKTAAALVRTFGTVEAMLAAIEAGHGGFPMNSRPKLAAARDYLDVAPAVVRVATDAPVPDVDGTLPLTPAAPDRLAALDERWDLGSSLRRALNALTERS
jgi:5'-3' exonuclease